MTGRDLLVGVDVGTTRVKAVLLDLAGHELADAAEPTPWLRLEDGSDLDPTTLADLVRALVGRVGDAAADLGGRVVGVGTTGMGEAGVAVDADGAPLAPIRAWFDRRADVDAVREALGEDAFHRAVGMPLDAQPSLPKLVRMQREHAAVRSAVRFYSVPEWAVVALGGSPGSEVSLASRTGLLDVVTGRSWTAAADLLGADLLGEPVLAGAPAGHVDAAGLPAAVRGAVLSVGGHDHQTAGMVAGAARDGMLFDSLGTAEALLRFARLVPTPDLAAAAVAAGLTLGRTVVGGHACLLAGLRTGFGLERVAGALGLATREARAALATESLALTGRRLASVTLEGESVVLRLTDGVTPAEVWRSAVGDLVDASADLTDRMAALVGPHTGTVATGGWLANPMVRHAKAAQLAGLRVVRLHEAGAAGAAYFAAVAAGAMPEPAVLDGPPWPVGDDPADVPTAPPSSPAPTRTTGEPATAGGATTDGAPDRVPHPTGGSDAGRRAVPVPEREVP
ncbi:L-fuculokinase [Kineosporia sp. A_224]|uniref:FGGY-family carbohydrate kinase n=1 Tax=Kineosporia sp. A_224 TaxID=1962180 RepID=UPI000B4BB690|nr:FGGY family carbohydrate kinase [Kineosporia sp. A_224]